MFFFCPLLDKIVSFTNDGRAAERWGCPRCPNVFARTDLIIFLNCNEIQVKNFERLRCLPYLLPQSRFGSVWVSFSKLFGSHDLRAMSKDSFVTLLEHHDFSNAPHKKGSVTPTPLETSIAPRSWTTQIRGVGVATKKVAIQQLCFVGSFFPWT